MNIDKILEKLDSIEESVSQMRDLLFCPEGIRITIWKGLIEYWDSDHNPNLISTIPKEKEYLDKTLYSVLSNMSLSDIENNKHKEILSDISLNDIPDFLKEAMIEVGINIYNKIDEDKHQEIIKQMEKKYASFYNS